MKSWLFDFNRHALACLAGTLLAACETATCPPNTVQVGDQCMPYMPQAANGTANQAPTGIEPSTPGAGAGGATASTAPGNAGNATAGPGAAGAAAGAGQPNSSAAGSSAAAPSADPMMTTPSDPAASGPCPDGSQPTEEACDGLDNDCDGVFDEALTEACGSSVMGTCMMGTTTCVDGTWGECEGAIEPTEEICDVDGLDENCDGISNDGCACTPGEEQPCGVTKGICREGYQTCNEGGVWSTECSDQVTPETEVCDGKSDEDCDGSVDERCECVDGESEMCDGNAMGECNPGMRTCNSGKWTTCAGRVQPKDRETCDGKDENCNGEVDDGATCSNGTKCVGGSCQDWCTDAECEAEGNTCQPKTCNETTGKCEDGLAASRGSACTEGSIKVGYCDSGRCMPDSEVVCTVGNLKANQWIFRDDPPNEYKVCAPNNCQNSSGFTSFGPCETKESKTPVVWTVFNSSPSDGRSEVERVYIQGKDKSCSSSSSGSCYMWFGWPETEDGRARIQCAIFDDGGAARIGQGDQFVPSLNGEGHPAARERATVCTPGQCRRWVGDCRVMQ